MTPREWARLQGFPDNYVIPVADASAYKQFGNSVAVPAIQATAKKIIEKQKIINGIITRFRYSKRQWNTCC
jgi:DNA (cytosine-5)-methyltransferase 1